MGCLSYLSWVLWFLGYPDQALKRSQEALSLAQEMSLPFNVALALNCAAMLHQFRREANLTQERAETAMALSTEQRFPQWVAMGSILQGCALAEQGRIDDGFVQMHRGGDTAKTLGAKVAAPWGFALMAEMLEKVEYVEVGLDLLAKALAVVGKTGERFYEAELYRLKGMLTLQKARQKAKGKKQKAKGSEAQSLALSPQSLPSPDSPIPRFFPRGMFPEGHRHRSSATGEVVRTAGGDEFESLVAPARQATRSAQHIVRGLRLVH